jgi:hypothetical protein
MTPYELEVSAYAAAHKIYSGLPAPDRPCPGGYRSRMIDQIAETIKETFQTDDGLASSYRETSPAGSTVRPEEVSAQHRYWREIQHVYDDGSPCPGMLPDRPCDRCGLPQDFAPYVPGRAPAFADIPALERDKLHGLDRRITTQTEAKI